MTQRGILPAYFGHYAVQRHFNVEGDHELGSAVSHDSPASVEMSSQVKSIRGAIYS
jgi:hypothetical protein